MFQDGNNNDIYDTGEGLVSRIVSLYQKDSLGNFNDTGITATTNVDGWYTFDVEVLQSYKVVFKVLDTGGVGVTGFTAKGSTDKSNHANEDGFSDEIVVGYLSANEKTHIVNAGYSPPFPVITGIYMDNMHWIVLVCFAGIAIMGVFL